MTHDVTQREQLSALADGELRDDEWDAALEYASSAAGQQVWQMYHVVGEALRTLQWVHLDRCNVLPAVQAHGAQTLHAAPTGVVQSPATSAPAANDAVLRWKVAAACACVTAAAAIGWNVLPSLGGAHEAGPAGALASATPDRAGTANFPLGATAQPSVVIAVTDPNVGSGQSAMLRDPRLDTLLATAGAAPVGAPAAAALQMPASFLRNASFAAGGGVRDCAAAHC